MTAFFILFFIFCIILGGAVVIDDIKRESVWQNPTDPIAKTIIKYLRKYPLKDWNVDCDNILYFHSQVPFSIRSYFNKMDCRTITLRSDKTNLFDAISETYNKQAVERLVREQEEEIATLKRDKLISTLKKRLESS